MLFRGAVAGSAVVGLLATWLTVGPVQAVESKSTVDWQPCSEERLQGFECGTLERPLDRTEPDGPRVQVAMVRLPSTGTSEQRIGTLFWNPGGPGGSGTASAGIGNLLPDDVREAFDFVTWDPRGIGKTTPAIVDCTAPMPTRPVTGSVNWQRVLNKRIRELAAINRNCYAQNSEIIDHAGTVEVAYDLDAMREAVGDEKLTYWGVSYGTMLGSTYAQLFPEKVRALVLDGNMDPQTSLLRLGNAASAADHAMGYFFEVYPDEKKKFERVLARLDRRAIALPDGTTYTRWDLLDTVAGRVPFVSAWPTVLIAIEESHMALYGDGEAKVEARQILAEEPALRTPTSDFNAGIFSAVLCQDFAGRPGRNQMRPILEWGVREGPWYGGSVAVDYLATCSGYGKVKPNPVPRPSRFGPDVSGLIVNSTRDGSTPYPWAVNMARTYPSMRMLTSPSGLHGTFVTARSTCINDAVGAYLTTGELPALDIVCPYEPPAVLG